MESHLTVIIKRLLPQAAEINAYMVDGLVLGYARDDQNALLDWPTQEAIQAEWLVLQAQLQAPSVEMTLAERIQLLEDTVLEAIAGGML